MHWEFICFFMWAWKKLGYMISFVLYYGQFFSFDRILLRGVAQSCCIPAKIIIVWNPYEILERFMHAGLLYRDWLFVNLQWNFNYICLIQWLFGLIFLGHSVCPLADFLIRSLLCSMYLWLFHIHGAFVWISRFCFGLVCSGCFDLQVGESLCCFFGKQSSIIGLHKIHRVQRQGFTSFFNPFNMWDRTIVRI